MTSAKTSRITRMTCRTANGRYVCLGFIGVGLVLVLWLNFSCVAGLSNRLPRSPGTLGQWLLWAQHSDTHLLRCYGRRRHTISWTYDQAIGIKALLAVGDVSAGASCAEAMLRIRNRERRAWADAYDTISSGLPIGPVLYGHQRILFMGRNRIVTKAGAIAVGPNAWMGLALLDLYQVTKRERYLDAAKDIGAFILSLQLSGGTTDGTVMGGYDENGEPFCWASTEHGADSVAFLAALAHVTSEARYRNAAVRVARWLNREMWNAKEKCYYPGYDNAAEGTISTFPERLDSQTWTILAFDAAISLPGWPRNAGAQPRNGLPWIDKFQCAVTYEGTSLCGFGKITQGDQATPSIWSEGTAGYVLAARRVKHKETDIVELVDSLQSLRQPDGSVLYSVGISLPEVAGQFRAGDIVVAHFEGHPNCLYGEMGVYGCASPNWEAIKTSGFRKPYSWYYDKGIPTYDKANVHSGRQSFCLVNGGKMCSPQSKSEGQWGSLGIELGPRLGTGGRVRPLDVTKCTSLVFGAKTNDTREVALKVALRDDRGKEKAALVRVQPADKDGTGHWTRHVIPLRMFAEGIDLQQLVNLVIEIGLEKLGNEKGAAVYLDDIVFVGEAPAGSGKKPRMPEVYPQHWPFGSVAGTAWLIFVERDINPFALLRTHEARP